MVLRRGALEGLAVSGDRFPLISILIPNYNYIKYVATAVDSALAQTYPNVEVIVSDNCSTDGAWELLNERYGADPRVLLHQNERNVGMVANFDRLLALARGRYIMCLSSDDFLYPPHLALLEAQLSRDPSLDVVLEPGMCGDPDNGQDARDWEVIIRLALAGKRFAYVAQPTMAIRLHADQFSGETYHRSGRNVLDYAAYVERYMDHPEFVRRMHGREAGVVRFLELLVAQGAAMNGGTSPFDDAQRAGFTALADRLTARGAEYVPALVRESRVSVIVQHGGAPYPLLRALDSIAAQSAPNWEVVLVDHSPISVEALVQAHPVHDRLSYLRLPTQHSAAAARNLGLRMVRGEYVAFLDSDDRFTPEHLERAIETIAREGTQVAVATARLVLERTNPPANVVETLGEVVPFGGDADAVAALPVAHSLPLASLVFYRGLIDALGRFDEGLPLLEDWDYALRMARATRFATTGAMTVDVTARLGLASQRLGVLFPHYLASLDRIYGAHAVDDALAQRRAAHRRDVTALIGVARDWIGEPHGLGAFMCGLAGRAAFAAAAR